MTGILAAATSSRTAKIRRNLFTGRLLAKQTSRDCVMTIEIIRLKKYSLLVSCGLFLVCIPTETVPWERENILQLVGWISDA